MGKRAFGVAHYMGNARYHLQSRRRDGAPSFSQLARRNLNHVIAWAQTTVADCLGSALTRSCSLTIRS